MSFARSPTDPSRVRAWVVRGVRRMDRGQVWHPCPWYWWSTARDGRRGFDRRGLSRGSRGDGRSGEPRRLRSGVAILRGSSDGSSARTWVRSRPSKSCREGPRCTMGPISPGACWTFQPELHQQRVLCTSGSSDLSAWCISD